MPGQNPKIKSEISPNQTLKKKKKNQTALKTHTHATTNNKLNHNSTQKTWNWSIIKIKRAVKIETYSNMLIWYWA